MFLSKLPLNVRNPLARRDLASPYELHRTLLGRGFDGRAKDALGRVLFRIDTDRFGANPVVLVQSAARPAWAALPAGYLAGPAAETDNLPAFLRQFGAAGGKLRFRLRANPTKRVAATNPRLGGTLAGRRVGLRADTERLAWVLRKGEGGGFRVPGEWVSRTDPNVRAATWQRDFAPGEWVPDFRVDVIPEGRDRNDKAAHRDGAFEAVRFEGVLEVTDADRFAATVRDGVGSAKGFGFGLLSVAPV